MSHDASELSLGPRLNRSDVHVDRTAGKRKSIDLFLLYYFERVRKFVSRSFRREFASQSVNVFRGRMIRRKQREFLFDLRNRFFTVVNLLFDRIAVAARRIVRN